MRMALIRKLLAEKDEKDLPREKGEIVGKNCACKNPHCISLTEKSIVPKYYRDRRGIVRCFWCDEGTEN